MVNNNRSKENNLSRLIKKLKKQNIVVRVVHRNYEDWFYDEDGPPVISIKEVNGEILITCDAREAIHTRRD